MASIELRPVTVDNWKDCAALRLGEGQSGFVRANVYSIAEAQFYPGCRSRAIYAGETLVGYALYGIDDRSGLWKIFRLMIDVSQQGRGYGRAAMLAILGEIARAPDRSDVLISFKSANAVARTLYADLGFVDVSETDGHMVARLSLQRLVASAGPSMGSSPGAGPSASSGPGAANVSRSA